MIARGLVWVLEVGWVALWALHLGLGGMPIALMAPAAVAAGLLRRRPALAVPVWLLAAGLGALAGHGWGAAPVLIALWRGASPPDREHPAVFERLAVALLATASLTYVSSDWSWAIPAALAVALAAALEIQRDPGTPRALQLDAAGRLGALGAAVGLAVLALLLSPPGNLAAQLLRRALGLSGPHPYGNAFLGIRGRGRVLKRLRRLSRLHHPAPPPHAATSLTWLWIALGALAVGGLLVYLLGRQRRRPLGPGLRDAAEARLARGGLGGPPGAPTGTPAVALTRRVLQTRMQREGRRRRGPKRGETVREWMQRLYGEAAAALAPLYEDVRYGGVADDAERAQALDAEWPREDPAMTRPSGEGDGSA